MGVSNRFLALVQNDHGAHVRLDLLAAFEHAHLVDVVADDVEVKDKILACEIK